MIKVILFAIVFSIALSACSTNQVPAKYNVDGDYIGWHCSADKNSPVEWSCEQKTQQGDKDNNSTSTEVDDTVVKTDAFDADVLGSDLKSAKTSHEETYNVATDAEVTITTGYQLQLGAYLSSLDATVAAKKIITVNAVKIASLMSKQTPVFVILYGHYESRDMAQQAALLLLQDNPELSYWIRSSASINNARLN